MPKYRNALAGAMLALSAAAAQPAAAQISGCYRDVLDDCADAMDGEGFLVRWTLGVICTGMLAGCAAR